MSTATSAGVRDTDVVTLTPPAAGRRGWVGYLTMPLILAVVLVSLYLYVNGRELDSIEARSLNAAALSTAVGEHVALTAVSTVITLLIAVPLGILLTRPFTRRVRPFIITLLTLGQAVPTISVLVLLAVMFLFLGFQAAIVGLVLYAIIPVLLNTMVGLEQVDENVLEAGRGMGLSRFQVLRRLELPLAVPVILAGVRTALVINVGTATLATYINGGGLGDVIMAGLSTNRVLVQVVGAVLTSVLALLIDYLAGLAENLLQPKGLRSART
ncbi:ABC transporter permease [Citricoccus nitrophenolicus]|uniref:Osmoprotectant transport system permease protein n=1 Tax=Citricoccus muralis TaxID=169134 RepID=A0A3D9L951_9MICC|nr:ABC transporter permease [Citricoccus muralis]REE02888.1 osmoprotectant transport system permease protein [Citricoccus muralis]